MYVCVFLCEQRVVAGVPCVSTVAALGVPGPPWPAVVAQPWAASSMAATEQVEAVALVLAVGSVQVVVVLVAAVVVVAVVEVVAAAVDVRTCRWRRSARYEWRPYPSTCCPS